MINPVVMQADPARSWRGIPLSCLLVCLWLMPALVTAADFFSRNSGKWTGNNRWSTVGCGGATAGNAEPLIGDSATICNGHRITLNTSIAGAGLSFLTINAGGQLQMGNSNTSRTLTVAGNVTNNGTLIIPTNRNNTYFLNIGGSLLNNNIFNMATDANSLVDVTLFGTLAQTVGGTANMNFNNLLVNKTAGTVTLIGAGVPLINGDLTVGASGGTLDLAGFTADRVAAGGTITVVNGATLRIGGTGGFPANFSTVILGATSTVEYNGTAQTVGAHNYGNLSISGSGTKVLAGNATVNGTLALNNGLVDTGVNQLIIASTGSVSRCLSGTDCFVVGKLTKAVPAGSPTINWEVGTAMPSPAYAPVTISFNGASAGDFQVSTPAAAADHPDTVAAGSGIDVDNSVNRYWTLTSLGAGFANYSPTFNYGNIAGDIDGMANPADFIIRQKTAGVWNDVTLSGTPTATSATGSGVISAAGDDFAIGEMAFAGPGACDPGIDLASGIIGEYFNIPAIPPTPLPGVTADGTRLDGPIDFDWGTGTSGVTGIGADQFAVRWDGRVRVMASGNYLFQTVSDDGVRLWVNEVLVIDNWTNHASATDTSATVALFAGQVYRLRLEYFENGGFSEVRLRWQRPADAGFAPIPPGPAPVPGEGLYHCPPPPPPTDIVVTLAGVATNISAGSVLLTGTLNGDPEAVNTGTNTGVATITTAITTLTDNAWLLDVVGSGNAGAFSPGVGQTERWDTSANTSTGAASTRPVPVAGGSSMSQTHSTASPRNAHAVVALAPGPAGLIAFDSAFAANINDAASLGWAHTVPLDFNGKLVVGVTVEDQPDCTGDQLVSSVTHEGVPLTFFTAVTTPAAGICMHVEIWYRDFGNPPEPFVCSGSLSPGILGEYFNIIAPPPTPLPAGTADGTRLDSPINFNWGGGTPGVIGIGANDFAVRWDGILRVTETGDYRFQTNSDDGVRLWVNDTLVIDNWTDHAPTLNTSADIPLVSGQIYPLRLEYYENGGGAVISLSWERPSDGSFSPIPPGTTPILGEGLYHCISVFLDHYDVAHAGVGVSCLSQQISFTAIDNSGDPIDPGNVVVTLAVDPVAPGPPPPKGNWVRVSNGSGTLSNPSANGTADYQFPGNGETSVTLVFNYTALETGNNSETINFNIADGTNNVTDARDSNPLTDPDMVISLAGFQFYNEDSGNEVIPVQIAGKPSNLLPNDDLLSLRAVRASDEDPSVCTAAFPDMSVVTVPLAAECLNPGTCAGRQLSVVNNSTTTAVATNADNAGSGSSAYTNVDLLFQDNGAGVSRALLVLDYPDVGEMQLHARYEVPLDEGGTPPAGAGSGGFMTGSSAPFVVRPFGFGVSAIQDGGGTPNPAADTPAGNLFVTAGTDFQATMAAFVWGAGDDDGTGCDLINDPGCLANDGVPDTNAELLDNNGGFPGSVALNFQGTGAVDVTLSAVAPSEPATAVGGVIGVLDNSLTSSAPVFPAGSFANGVSAALTTIRYLEAGSITLKLDSADYLGSGAAISGRSSNLPGLNPNNGVVGRFGADQFSFSANIPELGPACGGFSYVDQPFDYLIAPQITARAIAADGVTVLSNYEDFTGAGGDNWWLLDFGFAATALDPGVNMLYTDQTSPTDISLDSSLADYLPNSGSTGTDGQQQFVLSGPFAYAKNPPPASVQAPFDADLRLDFSVRDADGASGTYTVNSIDFPQSQQRWGRMTITNAGGSELLDLAAPLTTEYWNGTAFVTNTDDSCTQIENLGNGILLTNPDTGGGVPQPGNTAMVITDGSTQITPPAPISITSGRGSMVFSAPDDGDGIADTGFVEIEINLNISGSDDPWLQFDWDDVDGLGDGPYDGNPQGRATFGIFKGSNNFIYIREPWN